MTWTGFQINGIHKKLDHLRTHEITTEINNRSMILKVSFGCHCFTDEKKNGPKLQFKECRSKSRCKECRYWSEDRYIRSLELPSMIKNNFVDSYAVPYRHQHKNGEQYHYLEIYDYAIFFEITKPEKINDMLNLKIVTAYEIDDWGKGNTPPGKKYKVRWILQERLAGNSILKRKKR